MARGRHGDHHAQDFLPTVEALRPVTPWDRVVRALKGAGKVRPWDDRPWTPNSLIRAVRRLAAAGLIRQDALEAAPKRVDSTDLVLMVAGLARAEPGITLDGIARRLQHMGQRTPRGGARWSRSSVKHLLDRAKVQGVLREAGTVSCATSTTSVPTEAVACGEAVRGCDDPTGLPACGGVRMPVGAAAGGSVRVMPGDGPL